MRNNILGKGGGMSQVEEVEGGTKGETGMDGDAVGDMVGVRSWRVFCPARCRALLELESMWCPKEGRA